MSMTLQDPTLEVIDGQKYKAATPAQVLAALEAGSALVTVRSHQTGKHVTVRITGRKKKADGSGWVSRATTAGRVGFGTGADCLEVKDVLREYPDDYVGRLYTDKPGLDFKAGKDADPIRVWTAEKVLSYALDGLALKSDVFLATKCGVCGKGLHDPESIERGIGPECFGKATDSKVAH
jgi:hypothetical protein